MKKTHLSKKDRDLLMNLIKQTPDPKLAVKAFAVLLSDRMPTENVAAMLKYSSSQLRRLKIDFINHGLPALHDDRHEGGNRRLTGLPAEASILDLVWHQSNQDRVKFAVIRAAINNAAPHDLTDLSIRNMLARNGWHRAGWGFYEKR